MVSDVLIVDSDPKTRRELSLVTRASGYSVISFGDGELALEAMRRSVPRLVVVELRPPELAGLELCRSIRTELGHRSLPILCLAATGSAGPELRSLVARRFDARLLAKGTLEREYLALVDSVIGPPRDTEYRVEFRSTDEFVAEYADNLSMGGLFVTTDRLPARDSLIRISLVIPDQDRIDVDARVVYLVPPEQAVATGGRAGFGVELVDLPYPTRRLLDELARRFVRRAPGPG